MSATALETKGVGPCLLHFLFGNQYILASIKTRQPFTTIHFTLQVWRIHLPPGQGLPKEPPPPLQLLVKLSLCDPLETSMTGSASCVRAPLVCCMRTNTCRQSLPPCHFTMYWCLVLCCFTFLSTIMQWAVLYFAVLFCAVR